MTGLEVLLYPATLGLILGYRLQRSRGVSNKIVLLCVLLSMSLFILTMGVG